MSECEEDHLLFCLFVGVGIFGSKWFDRDPYPYYFRNGGGSEATIGMAGNGALRLYCVRGSI